MRSISAITEKVVEGKKSGTTKTKAMDAVDMATTFRIISHAEALKWYDIISRVYAD